jgi:hypothetical protein
LCVDGVDADVTTTPKFSVVDPKAIVLTAAVVAFGPIATEFANVA